MRQLTVALLLIVAIALQSAARAVWQPLGFVDLTLILVVYFALQREALQALVVAALAGLAMDLISGPPALLGAGGFSKVLTAYAVYFFASRVMLDTTLLRIPVLGAASLLDNLVYGSSFPSSGVSYAIGLVYYDPASPFTLKFSGNILVSTLAVDMSGRLRRRPVAA